jgi:hypothetical protein
VRPLAPSPAWTLVIPYCKRTRPGRGTNTKAAGFPPLSRPYPATFLPPSRSASRRPIWAGARSDISLVGPGTPGLEAPTPGYNEYGAKTHNDLFRLFTNWVLQAYTLFDSLKVVMGREAHQVFHSLALFYFYKDFPV